ncbi:MAG: Hsp20/alpha crystallin family protein [Bacteroidaceae bacterium]|nr:Hsp20/alpha crystallin family protein [Bacteroidaceae bacterium]
MTTIRRNYPTNWLPSIFDDFFDATMPRRNSTTAPAINVIEADKEYRVEVAAPGMNKDDFNIHLDEDGNLVIQLEKKQEQTEEQEKPRYLRREFSYTKFQQTLILPEDIEKDNIAARVADGVLTVTLPKLQPAEKTPLKRHIEVL